MIPTKIIEQNLRIIKKDKASQECRVWITSNTIQVGIQEDPEYQGIKGAYTILVMGYIWFLAGIKKSRLASCLIVKINEHMRIYQIKNREMNTMDFVISSRG
jgi:hypothetical protein